MTITTPDLDQLHVDAINAVEAFTLDRLDFDPTCEAVLTSARRPCVSPAQWSLNCGSCHATRFACNRCLTLFRKINLGRELVCKCGLTGPLDQLVIITPIGGTR